MSKKQKSKNEEQTTDAVGLSELLARLMPPKISTEYAYKMGVDCAINGANTTNCNFPIFSSPENTAAWERGKHNLPLDSKREEKTK